MQVTIAATGMITAVGCDTSTTSVAVKAGINRYAESLYCDTANEPIKMALVPDQALQALDPSLAGSLTSREQRLLRLAGPALEETMKSYSEQQPVALFLAVPESCPGSTFQVSPRFLQHLQQHTGLAIDVLNSRTIATGRSGGLESIELAFKYFQSTGARYALCGGVDSYQDLHLLASLDAEQRLNVEANLDGFVPGEGAGFVLLHHAPDGQADADKGFRVFMPAVASEEGHLFSDQPCLGDALADVMNRCLDYASRPNIQTVYASLNGESSGAKEFGVALTRNSGDLNDALELSYPASSFGDIGAAFGPVALGLASRADGVGASLLLCSSDGPARSALVVSRSA